MTNATPLDDWMIDRLVKRGTWKGVEWAIVNGGGIRSNRINGYVYLPEGHPWTVESDLYGRNDIEVHGGITYGGDGLPGGGTWIGFDTSHSGDIWGDDPEMDAAYRSSFPRHTTNWNEALVAKEARRLAAQVAEAKADPLPPVLPATTEAAKGAAWDAWTARYGEYNTDTRKAFEAGFNAASLAMGGKPE